MLDAVAAAAVEVAHAAGAARGRPDLLGDFLEVDAAHDLAGAGGKLGVFGDGQAGKTGGLGVLAGMVVAHQAVNVFFDAEVKFVVAPAVADMAAVAGRFVRTHRGAEVVDDVLLAQHLLGGGVDEFPLPVLGLVDLLGRLRVAAQAGLGHRGAGVKLPVQFLELAVVGCRFQQLDRRRRGGCASRCGKKNGRHSGSHQVSITHHIFLRLTSRYA